MVKSKLNAFFNKIFVINLYDNDSRWKNVKKQFSRRGISVDRFVAVDGRCKKGRKDCIEKLKSLDFLK